VTKKKYGRTTALREQIKKSEYRGGKNTGKRERYKGKGLFARKIKNVDTDKLGIRDQYFRMTSYSGGRGGPGSVVVQSCKNGNFDRRLKKDHFVQKICILNKESAFLSKEGRRGGVCEKEKS